MSTRVVLRRLLLLVLVAAAGAAGAEEPRTFLVYFGRPTIAVEVGGEPVGATDADGNLRFTLEVAAGAPIHFGTTTPGFALDAVKTVPAEDPGTVIHWDLSSELRIVAAPEEVSPPEPAARPAVRVDDPCRGRPSLPCMQRAWARFEAAVERRQCAAATATADELLADYPGLLNGREAVAALAAAYLDCGLATRAVELLAGFADGALWCQVAESRLLARGYEALGELAAAAEGAAGAEPQCGDDPSVALEWQFYFRCKLGQHERCARLAERAPQPLSRFLRAWWETLGAGTGSACQTRVELLPSGDLPCAGLPQDFCARQYGRILLACGTSRDDFATAARYLRDSLPAELLAGDAVGPKERELVALLAAAEYHSGSYAEAARLYDLVVRGLSAAELAEPAAATLRRRRADALMLAGGDELQAALASYEQVRSQLPPGSVEHAVVLNNVCVLRLRLGESGCDFEQLAAGLESLPEADRRLHLLLRRNLLALRLRVLAEDPELNDREKLIRLRQLRAAFDEYQQELASYPETAATEIVEHRGKSFAVALEEVMP